jgi:hypothetical protein
VLWGLWFVRPGEWRRLLPPLLAAAAATLLVAPLLWGYRVRLAEYGFARGMAEIRAFSADAVSLAGMFHASFAWRELLPHNSDETALFPGLTIVALAIVAVWQTRQRPDAPPSRWSRRLLVASAVVTAVVVWRVWTGPWGWEIGSIQLPPFDPHRVFSLAVLLALGGVLGTRWWRSAWGRRDPIVFYGAALFFLFLLALGPLPEWSTPWRVITYGPYWLLMQMPAYNAVRLPSRIWLVGVLCLAVLAAYGTAALLRRRGHRPALIAAALTILIVVEGSFAGGTAEAPAPMSPGLIPRGALVLDLPIEIGSTNGVAQYRAVLGGYRTINGYSGYEPDWFSAFLNELKRMGPRTFDAYRRREDLYVVARTGVDPVLLEWVASLPGAEPRPGAPHIYIHRLPRMPADPGR